MTRPGGRPGGSGPRPRGLAPTVAELIRRGEGELARLRALVGSAAMGQAAEAINQGRDDAMLLVADHPSREVVLARRYEAATERGTIRAIRLIRDLNGRARSRARAEDGPAAEVPPTPRATAMQPAPATVLVGVAAAGGDHGPATLAFALGRAGWGRSAPRKAAGCGGGRGTAAGGPPALDAPAPPRKRPDLRKLDRKRGRDGVETSRRVGCDRESTWMTAHRAGKRSSRGRS